MSTYEHTQQELREEIDGTRRELGATVEQLAAKTAVKTRLHDLVDHLKADLKRNIERRSVQAVAVGGAAIVLLIGWTVSRPTD
ncbi:MAG TPA: DUF3618 domain-containing protein [Solirubrobacteraceae bacterium]|nr:DUF3618 domain-containing protein [Solirubrobacteraceae bacterium]